MEHYYRGVCLSKNNQDNAISQSQSYYRKFKVSWVRRECWLRFLFEKGELPTLTPDDQIFIPEDFRPDEKDKKFYIRKFNTHLRIFVKQLIEEGKFSEFNSTFFAKMSIGNRSLMDGYYEMALKAESSFDYLLTILGKSNKTWMTEDQKIAIRLYDSTFFVQIEYQPVKKVSNLRDILKISEAKKEFKFTGKFVPTKKVLVKKNTEKLVPSSKVLVETV